ncbi:ribonuclease H-like domain-containing protein [Thelephora terrestris]|uniref:Ribonuclease H n=1 Tax=Thelephora terrestris TaxID=56493 RepID=A0A9P6HLW9_9AGAM|nr:ribonuclease H-like domain-containing protein [Thelephora terrestris]
MPKVVTGFYAVCKGREIGVFTTWDEAQSHVQGFPGAKFKKFKTLPEAEQWYKTNLPQRPANPQPTTTTPSTSTVSASNVVPRSSRSVGVSPVRSKPSPTTVPKLVPQSVPRVVAPTPAPAPVQLPRIAAPKNTTVEIVYSDGACKGNGGPGAVAGIGVWWGPNDPRNLSERCPGGQTNNRAELIAIARVLETVPKSTNTLIIRTDSQYSQNALTKWCLNWRKNGWRTAGGQPVTNKELIDYTLNLIETRHRSGQPVRLEYVKGHSGDIGNDGADALAVGGCNLPEIPERDWVGLKNAYNAVPDIMADFADIDPADFILSDEDLMRELEEDF